MHIRNVLTKAELECLSVDPELHALLSSGKVCFTCKKTRFSLFGTWATTCKFCRRNVCSLCVRKMRIPTEHFEHIPVYTLSPTPGSPLSEIDPVCDMTGSVPSSPDFARKLSPMDESPDGAVQSSSIAKLAATIGYVSQGRRGRAPLQRAQTSVRAPIPARVLEGGPMMNICRDCSTMVVNVVRASRRSLAAAPQGAMERVYSNCPSLKPSRNFHLDLKPVYKERKV